MVSMQFIFLFDISTILLMLILAYLSKRLGEAMKINSYYKMLYFTAFLIATATGTDFVTKTFCLQIPFFITLIIRLISSITAFLICLKYWNWLFPEFIKS
jgi:hypothetical protein